MYSTFKNFALVDNLNLDLDTTMCKCCDCGRVIPALTAYADNCDRAYCHHCIGDNYIASIYELAIGKLARYLDRLDIPYEDLNELHGGQQIRFPWCSGDVICHPYSYGGDDGKLETMGFTADGEDVSGRLTVLEALEVILHEWNERNKKMREGE